MAAVRFEPETEPSKTQQSTLFRKRTSLLDALDELDKQSKRDATMTSVEVLQSQGQTSSSGRPASGWSTLRRACPSPSAIRNANAAEDGDGQPVPQEPTATLPLPPTRPPAMQRERRRAALSGRDGNDSLAAITKLAAATATPQQHSELSRHCPEYRGKASATAAITPATPRSEGKAHSFRRPRSDDAAERMARRLNAVRTRRKHVLDLFSVFQTETEKNRAQQRLRHEGQQQPAALTGSHSSFEAVLRLYYPHATIAEQEEMAQWVATALAATTASTTVAHASEPVPSSMSGDPKVGGSQGGSVQRYFTPEERDEIGALFRRFDRDSSGTIEIDELLAAGWGEGEFGERELRRMFATVDTDDDDSIDLDGFTQLCSMCRQLDGGDLLKAATLNLRSMLKQQVQETTTFLQQKRPSLAGLCSSGWWHECQVGIIAEPSTSAGPAASGSGGMSVGEPAICMCSTSTC